MKRHDEIDELRSRPIEESRNRMDESRRLEERTAEIRGTYRMNATDKLHIPPELIPYGWEYYWVRNSVLGDTTFDRTGLMKRTGWTPVPADRHPYLVTDNLLGTNSSSKGFIFVDGLILHERPAIFGEEERQRKIEEHSRIMQDVPMEGMMGEPGCAGTVISNNIRHGDLRQSFM